MSKVIINRLNFTLTKFNDYPGLIKSLYNVYDGKDKTEDNNTIKSYLLLSGTESRVGGYESNTNAVGLDVTQQGLRGAVVTTRKNLPDVIEKIYDSAAKNPELTHQYLIDTYIKRNFQSGSQITALENPDLIKYKQFIRANSVVNPRDPHSKIEGKKIPIDDLFELDDGVSFKFAHDWTINNPASQWVNCGHITIFVPR